MTQPLLILNFRIWDYIPEGHAGPPECYVIHTWSGGFLDMVSALLHDLAPDPAPGEPPYPSGFKAGIMIWMGEGGSAWLLSIIERY